MGCNESNELCAASKCYLLKILCIRVFFLLYWTTHPAQTFSVSPSPFHTPSFEDWNSHILDTILPLCPLPISFSASYLCSLRRLVNNNIRSPFFFTSIPADHHHIYIQHQCYHILIIIYIFMPYRIMLPNLKQH